MYYLIGNLIVIGLHVGPGVTHRHACLPREREQGVGHLLLRCLVVLIFPVHGAVHDYEVGIVFTCHGGDFRHIDILDVAFAAEPFTIFVVEAVLGAYPAAVEPQDVDVAVVMRQLVDLVIGEIAETLPTLRIFLWVVIHVSVRRCPLFSPVIGVMPVGFREVETCCL